MMSDARFAAALVAAMDEEIAPLLERAGVDPSGGRHFGRARCWELTLGAQRLLAVRSGIGLVNAASAASAILAQYSLDALISCGSAGGLGGKVHVGDVVVGSSCVLSGADARAFGYALGQVPGMPARYEGDTALVATAMTGDGGDNYPRVVAGQVASADVFVDAARLAPLCHDFPDAAATDMESAALAQVAFSWGVPFVTVRGISDLCGPDAGSEHPTTVEDVSRLSTRVALAALGVASD